MSTGDGAAARALLALCLALFAATAGAAQTQEEKRRQLQQQLGIRPSRLDGGTLPTRDERPAAPPDERPPVDAGVAPPNGAKSSRPVSQGFAESAFPVLDNSCGSCHRASGMAGKTRLSISGTPTDYDVVLKLVDLQAPEESPLLKKATGATMHGGGKTLTATSPAYGTLLLWIQGGAKRNSTSARPVVSELPAVSQGPVGVVRPPVGTAATPDAQAPSVRTHVGAGDVRADIAADAGAGAGAANPSIAADASGGDASQSLSADGGVPARVLFSPALHQRLVASCGACHGPGLMGAARYLADPVGAAHFEIARALVVPGDARGSVLFRRASGEAHAAGPVWPPGHVDLALLGQWIDDGALGSEAPPTRAEVASPTDGSATPVMAAAPTGATEQLPVAPGHAGAGENRGFRIGAVPFLGELSLSGRFDLAFERGGYHDQPFQPGAVNALRSYHQFLFLDRRSAEDPFDVSVELLTLQLWEIGYRATTTGAPLQVRLKLGKLLVPFGGDPLFHHSYGGHAGFDQRVLPPVFAREGLALNVQRQVGPAALSADVYLVSGYGLRRADAELNLQSDFAPPEEVRLGAGARLGASLGPASLWYSPYFNSLGFGRRLFLQAVDLSVYKPRRLPLSLGAGLLRADVSGGAEQGFGGPGADYFHFASYLHLRVYPLPWLTLQYRQGLRSFGNQRGVYLDETDLGRDDGSTHNVGAIARYRGASVGLFHFWNLEKADEQADDFTRLLVSYDF